MKQMDWEIARLRTLPMLGTMISVFKLRSRRLTYTRNHYKLAFFNV